MGHMWYEKNPLGEYFDGVEKNRFLTKIGQKIGSLRRKFFEIFFALDRFRII